MTGPGWDGEGVDPWLPERIAAEARITAAEREMYKAWWGSFSRWIVRVNRGVLKGPTPDPHAVYSFAPLWAEEMGRFVAGPVSDAVGLAYRSLFGPDYHFDARPAVARHLAEVSNRMVRTPDAVFDVVAGEVAKGAGSGESIPKIAERVQTVLSTTGTETWKNRAVTVARTETLGGLNAGRSDAFVAVADVLDEPLEQQWLSTLDLRCRTAHLEADGDRVPVGTPFNVGGEPLMRPGDPNGSGWNVIQCVVGGTLVEYPGLRALTRSWYQGDVVQLRFASGDELTVTPNHPILRADGRWTPAGLLHEGDYCVSSSGLDRPRRAPDEECGPTDVGELYRAAEQRQRPDRIAVAPPDLHGDGGGRDGYVDVVAVDGALRINREAASDQEVDQFGLALADLARLRRRALDRTPGPWPHQNHVLHDLGAPAGIGRGGECRPLLVAERRHADPVGLAGAAQRDAQVIPQSGCNRGPGDAQRSRDSEHALATVVPDSQVIQVDGPPLGEPVRLARPSHLDAGPGQSCVDGRRADSECLGQGGSRLPRFVSTSQVIQVERHVFAGHVYNLDTGEGWYSANGITVRNCRCTTLLVRPDEQVDMTGRGFKDADDWWASQVAESS